MAVPAGLNIQVVADIYQSRRSLDDKLARGETRPQIMWNVERSHDRDVVVPALLHLEEQVARKMRHIDRCSAIDRGLFESRNANGSRSGLGDDNFVVLGITTDDEVAAGKQCRDISIQKQTGWTPDEDFYRFYIGRDAQGRPVAATIFLTEYTVHGPVRVAVALGPDGKVKGATVVELTEETYAWMRPLLDAQAHFVTANLGKGLDSMAQFYGQVVTGLIKRAALLYEVGVLKRGDSA